DPRVAVVDPHRGAEITEQARRRDPALAHPDDERVAWKRERHRSFSVARATRASMMLMIQNRTMTFGSAQPLSSKWWWMGAMRNTRCPVSLNETTCTITLIVSRAKMPPT